MAWQYMQLVCSLGPCKFVKYSRSVSPVLFYMSKIWAPRLPARLLSILRKVVIFSSSLQKGCDKHERAYMDV
jgi:hypothetical protein